MNSHEFSFHTEKEPFAPPSKGTLEQIFLNNEGLRAGWRLLIYIALVVAFVIGSETAVRFFIRPTPGSYPPFYLFALEAAHFVAVIGAAALMSRLERRSLDAYGLPLHSAFGKLFWKGCLLGLCEICALVGLIGAFGGYSFGSLAQHGPEILGWAFEWAIIFLFVGLFEEFTFRGYAQFTLADGIGFWPAAIVLSFLFGAVHLRNPGEGWVGALSVMVIGLVFAFALRRTGNLWFVVGMHVSFDFGETFLFSVPNSGMIFEGHLSNATLSGAKWLTGGSVGPEGSIFSFLTMSGVALAIHLFFPPKEKEKLSLEA